jgi:hypothetical protein
VVPAQLKGSTVVAVGGKRGWSGRHPRLSYALKLIGYIVTATLSATLILGVVRLLDGRKRRAGVIAGVIVVLAVQQATYQVWKAKLPGCWWPLGQFGALQLLIAAGSSEAGKRAGGTGKFHDQ